MTMALLCSLALWPLMLVVTAAGSIVGVPVISYLCIARKWGRTVNEVGRTIWVWTPQWAWLWSDNDQGICPGLVPSRWDAFKWTAVRNKVGNLRFLKPFGFWIHPSRVRSVGNAHDLYLPLPATAQDFFWNYTWHGCYTGLWIVWRNRVQLRIGWALTPADADGIEPGNLRQMWCGFTFQLQRHRNGA